MALLDIITMDDDPEGVLRRTAQPIDPAEIPDLQDLINNMIETASDIEAMGLAAPQIGVSKRLFVLNDGTVCINPSTKVGTGRVKSYAEGCLSLGTDNRYDIRRLREVTIKCLDREGKPQTLKPRQKIYSFAIQHEIDHLNGKLVCDKGKLRD